MKKVVLGFCLGTIGITILSSASDIIATWAELVKARMGVKITECGARINELNNAQTEEPRTRVIGFTTTNQEEEDDYDE